MTKSALDAREFARTLSARLREEYRVEEAFWRAHRRGSGQITINLLSDAADALDALAEERDELVERCARVCAEIGCDWRDADMNQKWLAAEYLVQQIRALKSKPQEASASPQQSKDFSQC